MFSIPAIPFTLLLPFIFQVYGYEKSTIYGKKGANGVTETQEWTRTLLYVISKWDSMAGIEKMMRKGITRREC